MKPLNLVSGEEFEAEILEVDKSEFISFKRSGQFIFDWAKERENSVYKIIAPVAEEDNIKIHGLISLSDFPKEYRIHINLIESTNENKSPNKKVDKVAGCLIAFAVRQAFEKGYFGFTSLLPKTKLIPLYTQKYGFQKYGKLYAIEGRNAIKLIEKYT